MPDIIIGTSAPDLAGLTAADALTACTDAGVGFQVTASVVNPAPAGKIISQTPAPFTDMEPGQIVSVVVSLGADAIGLISFLGLSPAAASAAVILQGFVPESHNIASIEGNLNVVVVQDPEAGSFVSLGTTIKLFTAVARPSGLPSIAMPSRFRAVTSL